MKPWVLVQIGKIEVRSHKALTKNGLIEIWAAAKCVTFESRTFVMDVSVFDPTTGEIAMQVTGARFGFFPVNPTKISFFVKNRYLSDTNHDIDAAIRPTKISLGFVGPGSGCIGADILDSLTSVGLNCHNFDADLDGEKWRAIDAMIIPLFCYNIVDLLELENLLVELLILIKKLSQLELQCATRKGGRVVFVSLLTGNATGRKNGALRGAIMGLIRSASLELGSRLELTHMESDEDIATARGLSNFSSQLYREVTSRENSNEFIYANGDRFSFKLSRIGDLLTEKELRDKISSASFGIDFEGVCIITGGFGGLGIVTAEVLVEIGFRSIVLVSRSGGMKGPNQGQKARLKGLQILGAKIICERCDTRNELEVVELLNRVRTSHGALRVVVDAA